MSALTINAVSRRLAPAIGFAVAVLVLLSWRIPAAGDGLGADVRFVGTPLGEVALEPAGTFAFGRALEPGEGEAHGRLTLANVAGGPLAVRVRGLPSNRELDRLLQVELRAGSRTLAHGRLARLREWTGRSVTLPRGGRTEIALRAWLPAGVRGPYEGRSVDVTLELRARPAE